ncbi:hypothetical protein MCC01971_16670 [Bifidobacteriaceae bacterium MCC01971]|nr:hypothetical protein MCC01971_16670 [Bifidobacteriaceae bacterium MCC01971]
MTEPKGYARLSNKLWLNDKTMSLALEHPSAFAAWVMSISYSSDNMTDGRLSKLALRRIMAAPDDVRLLVELGFWDALDDETLLIHDYLKHQNRRNSNDSETEAEAGPKSGPVSEAPLTKNEKLKTKDNNSFTPPTPSKPDFDDLLERIESFYPPNRFDGKTSQTRFQLEIDWPKVVRAAGEGHEDPAGFLEAKARSYVAATEPRYVVKFSKFLGSEFYARNWVREPPEAEPDARPSPRSRSIPQRSRSQANQDANAALIARYAAEEAAENQSREGVLTC